MLQSREKLLHEFVEWYRLVFIGEGSEEDHKRQEEVRREGLGRVRWSEGRSVWRDGERMEAGGGSRSVDVR